MVLLLVMTMVQAGYAPLIVIMMLLLLLLMLVLMDWLMLTDMIPVPFLLCKFDYN